MTTLSPLPERDALIPTRLSLHAVAEHVLAAARYEAEGRIGLRATPGGFATPIYERASAQEELRVVGCDLRVRQGAAESGHPITTVNAAAAAVGITPGAPADLYPPATSPDFDAPLPFDERSASALASWFALVWSVLTELATAHPDDAPSTITLWPEHFDTAVELGREDRGARGTFGGSPGDAEHPEPYLYVTHWADVPEDPYWNESTFAGASLGYSELLAADDAERAASEFYARGLAVLNPRG